MKDVINQILGKHIKGEAKLESIRKMLKNKYNIQIDAKALKRRLQNLRNKISKNPTQSL